VETERRFRPDDDWTSSAHADNGEVSFFEFTMHATLVWDMYLPRTFSVRRAGSDLQGVNSEELARLTLRTADENGNRLFRLSTILASRAGRRLCPAPGSVREANVLGLPDAVTACLVRWTGITQTAKVHDRPGRRRSTLPLAPVGGAQTALRHPSTGP